MTCPICGETMERQENDSYLCPRCSAVLTCAGRWECAAGRTERPTEKTFQVYE